MNSSKLSVAEQLFVFYLLQDERRNLTEAAVKAKLSDNRESCSSMGYRLSKSPAVVDLINKENKRRMDELRIDAKWVLKRAALLADFNINKFIKVNKKRGEAYYDFSKATDDDWYCISEYTADQIHKSVGDDKIAVDRVKLKTADKLKALELVGKHIDVQAFNEKVELDLTDRAAVIAEARKRAKNSGGQAE